MNGSVVRTAFVTGGSGAIGGDICLKLSECGFRVAVGYCKNKDGAVKIADAVCARGGRAIAVKCDITDYNSICAAKNEIDKIFGFTDTVVNCGGSEAYTLLCDQTPENIANTVACDLTGAIMVCKVFSPDMVSNRFGRIINVSSVWGKYGASVETVYSGAKAGVTGFTKALALELAPSLVTVNAVSPGFIDTPMNKRFSDSERRQILNDIPAGRFGTPADVSAAVAYFASNEASYVTGQDLIISGGMK